MRQLADVDIANRALARIGERPIQSLDEESSLAAQVVAVYSDVVDGAFGLYQWKWARRTSRLDALVVELPPQPLQLSGPPAPGDVPPGYWPPVAPAFPVPPTLPALVPGRFAPRAPGGPLPNPTPIYPGVGPAPGPQTYNGWPHAFGFPDNALSSPLAVFLRWPDHPTRDFAVEGRTVYARHRELYGTFVVRLGPADWPAPFRLAVTTWLAAELCVPVTQDQNLAATLFADATGTPSEGGRGGKLGRAIAMDAATGGQSAPLSGDPVTEARWEGAFNGGSLY